MGMAHTVPALESLGGVIIRHGILVALIGLGVVAVLACTVVALVMATDRKDRVQAIMQLAPILERLADTVAAPRFRQRKRRRKH
jgi:uncharacterized protein YcfJ